MSWRTKSSGRSNLNAKFTYKTCGCKDSTSHKELLCTASIQNIWNNSSFWITPHRKLFQTELSRSEHHSRFEHTYISVKGTAVTWWEVCEICPAIFLSYHPNKSSLEPDVIIESALFISADCVVNMLVSCFYVSYNDIWLFSELFVMIEHCFYRQWLFALKIKHIPLGESDPDMWKKGKGLICR